MKQGGADIPVCANPRSPQSSKFRHRQECLRYLSTPHRFARAIALCVLSLFIIHSSLFISCAAAQSAVAQRTWQGIPGIERTPNGRLFFTWFTGGKKEPMPENTVLLCYSDDAGKTHSPLQVIAAPADGSRCYDPVPWLDPKGRLWYIYNRGDKTTAQHGVFARICDNPDAPAPVFGPEFRIGFDAPFSFRINKPTVLSTGEWLMPVTYANKPVYDWSVNKNSKQPALQGAAISTDEGKTWQLRGAVEAPPWALESMITELKDGRLWLLIRTNAGVLYESFSTDKGATWSQGAPSAIANPGSRFFIRRLASGNLLLVNHSGFDPNAKTTNDKRSHLTAQLSTDDGKTWNNGLLLDARKSVSYPDGVQDKNGFIWIVYDRDRYGAGDILMAKFREEDVAQGKNASGAVHLRQVINNLAEAATDAVAAASEKLRAAMLSADAAALNAITADNLVYIHSAGLIQTKKEFVEAIATGVSKFDTIDLSGRQIKVTGDTAIERVIFDSKLVDHGVPQVVKLGLMLVWQKQAGVHESASGLTWKLIARQAQKL